MTIKNSFSCNDVSTSPIKALLSLWEGAYLILDILEGGLKERGPIIEGGLFTKSNEEDICEGSSVLFAPYRVRV